LFLQHKTNQQAFRGIENPRSDDEGKWVLNPASEFNNEKIVQVACGSCHSIFLSESFTVYGVGYNSTYQILGPSDVAKFHRTVPALVTQNGAEDDDDNDGNDDETVASSGKLTKKVVPVTCFKSHLLPNEVIVRIGCIGFGTIFYTSMERVLFAGKHTNQSKYHEFKEIKGAHASFLSMSNNSETIVQFNKEEQQIQVLKCKDVVPEKLILKRRKSVSSSSNDNDDENEQVAKEGNNEEAEAKEKKKKSEITSMDTIVKTVSTRGFQIKYLVGGPKHYCFALQSCSLFKYYKANKKMAACDLVIRFTE